MPPRRARRVDTPLAMSKTLGVPRSGSWFAFAEGATRPGQTSVALAARVSRQLEHGARWIAWAQ